MREFPGGETPQSRLLCSRISLRRESSLDRSETRAVTTIATDTSELRELLSWAKGSDDRRYWTVAGECEGGSGQNLTIIRKTRSRQSVALT